MECQTDEERPQIFFKTKLEANTQFVPKPVMQPCSAEVNEAIKLFEIELQEKADEANEFVDYSKLYSERTFPLDNWREYGQHIPAKNKTQSHAEESSSFDFISEPDEETTDEEFKI